MAATIEEKEALLFGLLGERDALTKQIAELHTKRAGLTLADKKEAKAMMQEILTLERQRSNLKPQIQAARVEVERVERHGLWESAVLALWGKDGLTACRAQMRSLRNAREHA